MKRKKLLLLLAALAILCLLGVRFSGLAYWGLATVLAFPWQLIGTGLRALSQAGPLGNGAAWVLYILICLLPLLLLWPVRKRGWRWEDGLPILISLLLFYSLYYLINPGSLLLYWMGMEEGLLLERCILGGVIDSSLCAYLILRLLRLFRAAGADQLHRYLSWLLNLLCLAFVYLIFGAGLTDWRQAALSLSAANQGPEAALGWSYAFLALNYGVNWLLAYGLDLWVTWSALDLLAELQKERYSVAVVNAADRLAKRSVGALSAIVLANLAVNCSQLLWIQKLRISSYSLHFPWFSLAFVLAALLLSRYISENQRLKADNDSFI